MSPGARLSTHVLDLRLGAPAAGVGVGVRSADGTLLAETRTNADGRTDAPLLAPGELRPGRYELSFAVAEYLAGTGLPAEERPFLDVVVVRFGVGDPVADHHVPLLFTPWSYSVYRGS